MKKLYVFLFVLFFIVQANSQTLINFYPFQYYNAYNGFWGVTQRNDTLWIGTDYDNTTNYPLSMLYKVTKSGTIVDSLTTPYKFDHGLAWDGTGFWIAEDYRSSGARLYKISATGQKMDSIYLGNYAGGIGGIALDGNNLWVATYYPDFTSYPFAYAYKINLTTKLPVDTIPLRGKQVQGIAVKGDTIFYVTDNFQSDPERIYAYRKAVGDTLFSFPAPDPDNDCDPRGMFWDGQNLWLIANRVGNNIMAFRTLYKYQIGGQGNPIISLSGNLFNFGLVGIGTTSNQTLNISNNGTSKLIITGKNISNSQFVISPANVPDTILAGANKNYTLSYSPTSTDSISATLEIASNDIVQPVKTVTLKGKGFLTGANISLSASSFDYQQRRVNSTCGYIFTITNIGNTDLNISSMSFTSPRYRVDTTLMSYPVVIPGQGNKKVRVWFNPNSATSFNDSLTILSNALNSPTSRIQFTGSGVVTGANLGDQLWTAITPDNPYTSADDPQPTSMKQINDVNGDGKSDLIVCSGNYLTCCWNGNSSVTGDLIWSFNTGYNNNNTGSVFYDVAMQVRSDVDGDGVQDVVIGCGGGNEMVYTISGRTGVQIWAWGDSINYSDGDIEAVKVNKDYNNDGVNDVVVSNSGSGNGQGRHALIILNGLNGQQLYYVTENSEFTGDVVNTPTGGAIGLGSNSGSYSIQGFDNMGSNTWNYSLNGKVWNMELIPSIDADTVKEILGFYGFSSSVVCLASDNGAVKWTATYGSGNIGYLEILDDLDSNGGVDFTLSGPQTIMRLDSKTHNALWQYSPGMSYIRSVDFLSDLNGDGIKDIIYGMQNPGNVLILSGSNGQVFFNYSFGNGVANRADRVTGINSIDANSTMEFAAGCRDGRLILFSGGPNDPIGVQNISSEVPTAFDLSQNFPNPFNPVTTIKFDIPTNTEASLVIFDASGREILNKNFGKLSTGMYEYRFDGTGFASGVYFYKLTAGKYTSVKKMMLIK